MDYASLDDEALIRLITHRRQEGLRELYDRYVRLVFSVALGSLGETGAAEEITQEVFIQVWKNAASYHPQRGKVATWLASIARYRSIDWLRRRSVRPEAHRAPWVEGLIHAIPASEHPEAQVELIQLQRRVRQAVAQLPKEQRSVLALAFFQGHTHREIAEALTLPLGTVKTRIRLAMQKLRVALMEERQVQER